MWYKSTSVIKSYKNITIVETYMITGYSTGQFQYLIRYSLEYRPICDAPVPNHDCDVIKWHIWTLFALQCQPSIAATWNGKLWHAHCTDHEWVYTTNLIFLKKI